MCDCATIIAHYQKKVGAPCRPLSISNPFKPHTFCLSIIANCPFLFDHFFYCHRFLATSKMGEVHFQSDYISSNRGITKIIQIVLGFVVCSVLCSNWYGGYSCFGEGRLGYVSGLNFVCVVINIVFFLLNLFNIRPLKAEQLYNVIAAILFLVAIVLLLWYMIQYNYWDIWMIIAAMCVLVIFLLFQWDFKGNRTMSDGHLPI